MNVVVIGTGYVGLVTGSCFAETGNNVWCVDVNAEKIKNLNNGIIPIFEPGLEEIVIRNRENGRLKFTTDLSECLDKADIVFSAVGTPSDVDGSADLKYVLGVARQIGQLITNKKVIVTKSTVPVGTAKKIKAAIDEELAKRGAEVEFYVASNPEFLKEGSAVNDFLKPERVVVGVDNVYPEELFRELYKPFVIDNESKLIVTDIPSAEMIKYASNSMLATRISFMNEIANLCEKVGANVDNVRRGMGSDTRIGSKFLYAGCGYGGSCFPKDVKALIKTGQENGCWMEILTAVENVNRQQKTVLYRKFFDFCHKNKITGFGDLNIAVWGLAFKPNTDDMREAPSVELISDLKALGVKNIKATDPEAFHEAKKYFGDTITYCDDKYEAAKDADFIFLVTEWNDFRNIDWARIKENAPNLKLVVDGRNIYDKETLKLKDIEYVCIGK